MSIIQRTSRTFILVIFNVIFLSCNQGIEFSKYETLDNSTWESNKRLSFKFTIKDTIKPKEPNTHLIISELPSKKDQ